MTHYLVGDVSNEHGHLGVVSRADRIQRLRDKQLPIERRLREVEISHDDVIARHAAIPGTAYRPVGKATGRT